MAVFYGKPRCVKIAKVVAILITVLFLIGHVLEAIFDWEEGNREWYIRAGGLALQIIGAVIVIVIVVSEVRCLLLTALILLFIGAAINLLVINLLFILVAVNNRNPVWSGNLYNENYDPKLELIALIIAVEFAAAIYFILEAIRFYCIWKVYSWASQSRVITTVTAGRPQITMRTNLP